MKDNNDNSNESIVKKGVIKDAWKIRKELAEEHGVPTKFIDWSSCIKRAMKGAGRVTDCWGRKLGSGKSKTNLWLLTESSIIVDSEEVSKGTGFMESWVVSYLGELVKRGFLSEDTGWTTIKADARPFPQPEA